MPLAAERTDEGDDDDDDDSTSYFEHEPFAIICFF